MKVCFFTREYPPNVYGGAGVHIKNLSRQLAALIDVEVRCFGEQKLDEPQLKVRGHGAWSRMSEGGEPRFNSALGTFSTGLSMVRDHIDADLVHSHTWYASLPGFFAKNLYRIPLVCSVHSLEPLRPWKEEQLGNSYHLTTWIEKTALENADRIVAVSSNSRAEILEHFKIDPERVKVIYNGIDLDVWNFSRETKTRREWGIEGDYILFVGRVSRQKGMEHLIDAMSHVDPGVTCVCCTAAPDTKELELEYQARVEAQPRVKWINKQLKEENYVELYSNSRLFVCPSIYEPFGIINLEAMACERAVVASAVGGIREVVVDGVTGYQVPPADPRALADAINKVLRDRKLAEAMGQAGRKRVEEHFSWKSIAAKTRDMYGELLEEWKSTHAGK
ncbi:MAG: glycogen synthase [Deltaproteobacteria bacterium]|nr:glycogen synthase [Deltaproteobacteria bacterium]